MSEYKETDGSGKEEAAKIDLMDLARDMLQGLKKFWWLVIGLAAAFALQAYFTVSSGYVPQYVASATMAVRFMGQDAEYINNQSAEQLEKVFPYILTSGVLQAVVAEDLGLDSVPGSISASAESGTNFFTLSVTANDAQMAYDILQSVIVNYPQVARFVIGETELDILDETGVPEDTGSSYFFRGSARNGAVKGALLGLAVVVLYVVTRQTVKSRKELKRILNLEDYGSIPYVARKKRKKNKSKEKYSLNLMNDRIPQGYLESVRKLRVRVIKEMEDRQYKSLLVTSSVPGEGKTTVAVNLAIAIARQGKNVILADCDPRNPSVASAMGEEKEHAGLGAVLRKQVTAADALTEVQVPAGSLKILYGGESKDKDSNLLGTGAMKNLIDALEEQADIVILDTAPSSLLADAPVLAKFSDAALYVVKYDQAKKRQIRDGVQSLVMSGTDILGYVFNADKNSRSRSYGYGYSYGYRQYGSYGHYGHYGNADKREDNSGRVIKD